MAAGKAGESRTVEVQGEQVTVLASKAESYRTLKLCGVIADPDEPDYRRTRALMDLAGYLTDWDEERIVERFGGEDASIADVVGFATAIVSEAVPKN